MPKRGRKRRGRPRTGKARQVMPVRLDAKQVKKIARLVEIHGGDRSTVMRRVIDSGLDSTWVILSLRKPGTKGRGAAQSGASFAWWRPSSRPRLRKWQRSVPPGLIRSRLKSKPTAHANMRPHLRWPRLIGLPWRKLKGRSPPRQPKRTRRLPQRIDRDATDSST